MLQHKQIMVFDMPFIFPSRNTTEGMHHMKYWRLKKLWVSPCRLFVKSEMRKNGWKKFLVPVHVDITAYFRKVRTRDADNYSPKFLFDAMKGLVFADDDCKNVTYRVNFRESDTDDHMVVVVEEKA